MANIALILTALKAFTAFWSLLTLAVSAATIAKFNDYLRTYRYSGSGFDSGNAVVAASVLSLLYFSTALVFLFVFPESILISVLVDTIVMGFLWILVLGSVASLSTNASYFSSCRADFCNLGSATVGLGWILFFLIFGILAFEIFYTLKNYGTSYATWRTPIAQLVVYGDRKTTGGIGNQPSTSVIGGVPMTSTGAGATHAQAPAVAPAPAPATHQAV